MSYLMGLITGALLACVAIGYVFATTTIVYRSTLFDGQSVKVTAVRS